MTGDGRLLRLRAEDGEDVAVLSAVLMLVFAAAAGITITRLGGATFAKAAGIDAVLVPYKGSAEVVQGLLTGSVDFILDGVAPSLAPIAGGEFRPEARVVEVADQVHAGVGLEVEVADLTPLRADAGDNVAVDPGLGLGAVGLRVTADVQQRRDGRPVQVGERPGEPQGFFKQHGRCPAGRLRS